MCVDEKEVLVFNFQVISFSSNVSSTCEIDYLGVKLYLVR